MPITDSGTLKSMVCVMRDSGMTFQEISDKLANEYGVHRTRQALHGLYSRSQKEKDTTLPESEAKLVVDVVNLYCLGYNMTAITNIMNNAGIDINYNKVGNIVHNYESYINSVQQTMLCKAIEILATEKNPTNIKARYSHLGMYITDRTFNRLIRNAYISIIQKSVSEYIMEAYEMCGDKETLKTLADRFNIDIGSLKVKQN